MKRIPITPFLILAALFTVIGASVYMEAEAEKRKQEELQRQQEEYLEKYEKAENAILMQDYNTAVELLENLPENFKDKEYVLVYAKYCKSVADGETIHTQYRITWELPHEGDMYTGDFAEEMKIARETAAKENEAEERRLKKEKEKKEICEKDETTSLGFLLFPLRCVFIIIAFPYDLMKRFKTVINLFLNKK